MRAPFRILGFVILATLVLGGKRPQKGVESSETVAPLDGESASADGFNGEARRFALIVGHNEGGPGKTPLRFAENATWS